MEPWPEVDLCPTCYEDRCPACGKLAADGATFDADTFTADCDDCVGSRFAFSRAYRRLDQAR